MIELFAFHLYRPSVPVVFPMAACEPADEHADSKGQQQPPEKLVNQIIHSSSSLIGSIHIIGAGTSSIPATLQRGYSPVTSTSH